MRIKTNLSIDLWLEIVKAIGYIRNRTLVQKLVQKTPFKAIKKKKPQYTHMHVYRCRAYPLDYYIPKKKKLEPRAYIGYLVGYDSTNIYRIWILTYKKVICTRDVTMDNNLLYNPTDLVLSDMIKEEVDRLIETLDIQEKDTIEPTNDNSLLDTTITKASTITKTNNNTQLENQQLITPSPTPSLSPTSIRSPKPMDFEIVIN